MDSDGDGLSDYNETNVYGTDPFLTDTDGDGCSDGFEIANNFDPLNPGDCGAVSDEKLGWSRMKTLYR